MSATNGDLLATMWREEWRLHAELFGGGRFLTFPFVVLLLTAGAGLGLATVGVDPATVETGLRALALLFGLYAGTAGFVGTDAVRDLLGNVSLVLATADILPLSRRRMLGLFLVKDAAFYAVVFLAPMAVGFAPLATTVAATPGAAALTVGLLWAETTALFAFGMAVTVALVAASTRGVSRAALLAGTGVVALAAWTTGAAATVLVAPTGGAGLVILPAAALLGGAAVAGYDPAYASPSRTATARIDRLAGWLPGDDDGLLAKSLLSLARSSGGVAKPVVSAGLLLAVAAGLAMLVETIAGVAPAPGTFFGGVLALSAFTTYNWLTTTDALDDYRILPVRIAAVFTAKRRGFAVVGLPVAVAAYLVALVAFPPHPVDALVGFALLLSASVYYFGLTVYLAGFDPNEFLFDPIRFGLFGVGVGVVLAPAVIGSFLPAVGRADATTVALALTGCALVGLAGTLLAHRAGPRWEERLRTSNS